MDLFWLYDIPTWSMFFLAIGLTCAISLFGCLVFRGKFHRWLGLDSRTNEIVAHFLSFTGVFYGIVLGLVAVGAWETFNGAGDRAEKEASAIAAFYRVVTQLPDPHRTELQGITRSYVVQVIEQDWPAQQRGEVPKAGDPIISELAGRLYAVPVTSPNVELALNNATGEFSGIVEARRDRIAQAKAALPSSLWWVIIAGTMINIGMTWMLNIENRRLDIVVNLMMAVLMGSVLAFVIAMDHPFRGEVSVTPDVYNIVLDRVIGPAETQASADANPDP